MKLFIIIAILFVLSTPQAHAKSADLSREEVNKAIEKAEKYYEGLYVDVGERGAVVKEFYSSPKSKYTVRHGVIGGMYYYEHKGEKEKAAKLRKFAVDHGFTPEDDIHSHIWRKKSTEKPEDLYSDKAYKDCFVKLPEMGNLIPHQSKVCRLGTVGRTAYKEISKRDTLIPAIEQLQRIESGKKVDEKIVKDLEEKFDELGNGVPMCFMDYCQDASSAIRTATFGELQLRLGNMKYADKAALALLKAQDKNGAIYFSYDKNGRLKADKTWIYLMISKMLADNPIFHGYVPTNAESMADILAFLSHWRCAKFGICR